MFTPSEFISKIAATDAGSGLIKEINAFYSKGKSNDMGVSEPNQAIFTDAGDLDSGEKRSAYLFKLGYTQKLAQAGVKVPMPTVPPPPKVVLPKPVVAKMTPAKLTPSTVPEQKLPIPKPTKLPLNPSPRLAKPSPLPGRDKVAFAAGFDAAVKKAQNIQPQQGSWLNSLATPKNKSLKPTIIDRNKTSPTFGRYIQPNKPSVYVDSVLESLGKVAPTPKYRPGPMKLVDADTDPLTQRFMREADLSSGFDPEWTKLLEQNKLPALQRSKVPALPSLPEPGFTNGLAEAAVGKRMADLASGTPAPTAPKLPGTSNLEQFMKFMKTHKTPLAIGAAGLGGAGLLAAIQHMRRKPKKEENND